MQCARVGPNLAYHVRVADENGVSLGARKVGKVTQLLRELCGSHTLLSLAENEGRISVLNSNGSIVHDLFSAAYPLPVRPLLCGHRSTVCRYLRA